MISEMRRGSGVMILVMIDPKGEWSSQALFRREASEER